MRKCTSLSNQTLDVVEKAASPLPGKAAFSCSTNSRFLTHKTYLFFPLLQTAVVIHSLLSSMHYFCGGLAKGPAALVVQTEGQRIALKRRGEARV